MESSYTIINYLASNFPEAYKSLVFSKWLRSLRFGNDYFRLIDSDAYYTIYHKYIELLLNRPNTIIRFAVLSDDKDVVLGWSLIEGVTLHYVYVHKDNRKQGIGTNLISPELKYITHITKDGIAFWTSKLPEAKFNPFI
jgi:GNAT superfamily N-acetyltransferase